MRSELSREEIADIRSDGPQVVTDGSWQALCDMALAHPDSKEAGRVSVPCKMFAACVLWLEQAAEFGIDAKYGDGTPTPNSQNIAALLSELRTLSAAPAPAATTGAGEVGVYVENVDDKDAAMAEFGKLVDGAASFSGKLPILVENGLCIALTGTGPLGMRNAYRIADALNAAPSPDAPVCDDAGGRQE